MADETLTMALDLYDRHMPFFLGQVASPPGLRIEALEVGMVPPRRHGVRRHARMLHDREFDIAEVSLASYIMARAAGAPFTAVPVFPRRLFSQNHIFVAEGSGIRSPRDLVGKRVAIWAFQVTMSVLARGDLARDYGVDWRDIDWVTQHPEEMPWSGEGVCRIERLPEGADVAAMLKQGAVDAYIFPHPPRAVVTPGSGIRRLFDDPEAECVRYVERHGYYPIMHLLALRQDVAERHPGLPCALIRMWDEAVEHADEYYVDPSFSMLAFARTQYERQHRALGPHPWVSGMAANRRNLEDFIGWCVEHGLVPPGIGIPDLFHASVLDS